MELKPKIANHTGELRRLLIVPYGIETYSEEGEGAGDGLLIVPYGIET